MNSLNNYNRQIIKIFLRDYREIFNLLNIPPLYTTFRPLYQYFHQYSKISCLIIIRIILLTIEVDILFQQMFLHFQNCFQHFHIIFQILYPVREDQDQYLQSDLILHELTSPNVLLMQRLFTC